MKLRLLDPKARAILKESCRKRRRVFPDIDTLLGRLADDLIVDVRDVHHVPDFPFALQVPAQDIFKNIGSEVPDMGKIMHRWTARIHPYRVAIGGCERLGCSCKGVR